MDKEYLYFLFNVLTVVLLVIAFIYLLVLSIIVRDYQIIVQRPFLFFIELLFMIVLPSIPILFFKISRNISMRDAIIWASNFAWQSGAFHIVLQLSGVYSYLFGMI